MTEQHSKQLRQEDRILILAPIGRDAEMTATFLSSSGLQVETFGDIEALCHTIPLGAGLVFLTGEALSPQAIHCLFEELGRQAQWSDIPLLVLTSGGGETPENDNALRAIGEKANVTLVERPVRGATLLSAVRSALRARHRQYDVRNHLAQEQRTKAALGQSEERLRIALDAAQLGAWALDLSSFQMECSASCKANFGLLPDADFNYEALIETVHPDDRAAMQVSIAKALQERGDYRQEFRVIWPDGATHWVLASGRASYSAAGEPQGMVGVTLDITERKAADEEREHLFLLEQTARTEAEAASRLKDEFLATVSHELRTPLTAILGWSHMLQSGRCDENVTEVALETIERNARAQAQLIDDLLDVSRIITGKLRLDMQPVDLAEVIAATINAVRPSADAKEIDLQLALDPDAALTIGDADRLQQVVWNLLTNAVKFTPEGGHIEVSLGHADSHIEICVTDTGVGIDPDFLAAVFDRFRQADQTSTRSHGGLGLGLSIVRQLVELHGGTVSAQSNGEGRGSTFVVRLPPGKPRPAHQRAAEPSPAEAQNHAVIADTGKNGGQLGQLRILVVDDEPDTRNLLQVMLGQRGASVKTAQSASEALQIFGDWKPEILVSDIGMPGEDGYALISKVRSLEVAQGGTVPAIALTAYARDRDRENALRAGFQAHIAKPIEPDDLVAAVASLTGRAA